MTYDQGREMAQHRQLEQQARIAIYFAHPPTTYEGSHLSENTNAYSANTCPKTKTSAAFPSNNPTLSPSNSTAKPRNHSA